MSNNMYQLKQAWAGLRAKKGFLVTVVTTLAITLGALLSILTLVYVSIAKPLPYPEQENLYQVNSKLYGGEDLIGRMYNHMSLMHLFDNQTLFSQSAVVEYGHGVISSLPTQPALQVTAVTPSWFTLLGSKMALGRSFEQTEAINSNNPVAILSYETWQNEFNGDNTILEQSIVVSGNSFRVVGVLAETFIEPHLFSYRINTGVFLPWDYNSIDERRRQSWTGFRGTLTFLGKLDSSLSKTQIEQNLTTLVNSTWKENVGSNPRHENEEIRMDIQLLKTAILGDGKNTVLLLLAGVIGLVLIAFTNIINLFMSRTAEQQGQLGIRAAVGATKKHLFQTLFAQSGLVVLISVLVALAIASGGFWVMQQYLAESLPRVNELTINSITLASAFLIALVLALLIARLSANMINYRALNATLQSSGKGTGIQVSRKVRRWLVISQITIVTILVFANMGLLRNSLEIINQPPGFETENISTLTLSITDARGIPLEERKALMQELKGKLMALPQVEDVAQSASPLDDGARRSFTVEETQENLVGVIRRPVDDQYFQMIEQSLIEGDYYTSADIINENKVLIVNDVFAAKVAPQGSALGVKIRAGRDLYTIIGVVKGVPMPAATEVPMRAYPTMWQERPSFLLKLKPQQTLSRELVVPTLQEVSGRLQLSTLDALDAKRNELLFTQYLTVITTAVLAVLTFFLASIGLYGILNYATQMRRFELGTRLAIGAKRKDVIGLIIKDNAGAAGIGFVISLIILSVLFIGFSEALASYINPQLVTLFVVTLGLSSIMTIFACYWPLRPIINNPPIRSLQGSQ